MKSFREYLTESKKVYEFKIKIAGELESDASKKIKLALEKYNVESCSSGKRSPIQESPVDFPEHHNVNVTIFDVSLSYPTTSVMIKEAIAEKLSLTDSCIKVCNIKEQEEYELNHQFDKKSGEALLTKDYEDKGAQDIVGDKHTMNLLKELNKVKHAGEQFKGVNDDILAKSTPSETSEGPAAKSIKTNNISPVGSRKIKLPTAKTAGGKNK